MQTLRVPMIKKHPSQLTKIWPSLCRRQYCDELTYDVEIVIRKTLVLRFG